MKHKVKAATRHKHLRQAGIAAMGGYDAQLAKQGGRCALCGRTPKVIKLSVDHDHLTGAPRGLLCQRCNRMVGWSGDSPAVLNGAAIYLKYGWGAAVTFRDARERL